MKSKAGRMVAVFLVMAMVLGVVLTGCGESKEPVAAATNAPVADSSALKAADGEIYYMLSFFSGHDYWKGCYKGFQDAAGLYGAKVSYTGSKGGDVNEQVTVLEQVIAMKPSGIAIACVNAEALEVPIKKAIDMGIPVITYDADSTPESGRLAFLGTGNYQAGAAAARALADLIGGEGEVGLLRFPGLSSTHARGEGFLDTIKNEFPKIKCVQEVNSKIDQAESAKGTSAMIQAYPNIKGIFTTDSASGVGAGTVIKEAGKAGQIKIISFDTDKGTLDMIKEGILDGTVAQGTYHMGYWTMNFLFSYKHGLVNPFDGWKDADATALPPLVDTGYTIVKKENVELFYDRY